VVDDGIATGSSMRAGCQVLRALGAARIVVAVPVASRMAVSDVRRECDDLVCLDAPDPFFAVGEWYRDFSQAGDDEVIELLRRAAGRWEEPPIDAERDEDVEIRTDGITLAGRLTIPRGARGTVLFAHGSGSSRHSPRNRCVATVLQRAGLATMLMDLLTPIEEQDHSIVFDVPLLGARLVEATRWMAAMPELSPVPTGYFGASTGAAAALWAAAQTNCPVAAVVCRGGRPDLVAPLLPAVKAPTLLIVGGNDEPVLELNRKAQAELLCENDLAVVPDASHLFEEPGALDAAAVLARDWFIPRLVPAEAP
jgi:putative phosphoribosyl transferase